MYALAWSSSGYECTLFGRVWERPERGTYRKQKSVVLLKVGNYRPHNVPWGSRVHSVWRTVLASHNTDVWADAIWGSENKTECGGAVQGIQSGDPRIQKENGKWSDGNQSKKLWHKWPNTRAQSKASHKHTPACGDSPPTGYNAINRPSPIWAEAIGRDR